MTDTNTDLATQAQNTVDIIHESVRNLKTHSAAAAGPGTMIHDQIKHLEDAAHKLAAKLKLHKDAEPVVPPPAGKPVETTPAANGDAQKAKDENKQEAKA